MENTIERTVYVNGRAISYKLTQKPVKNLNLRIRKDGSVSVSANTLVPLSEIDAFVIAKGDYVLNAIAKFKDMEKYRPEPKRYVSGETFLIQGHGLRLIVSQASRDTIASDGIYIYLDVKDTGDFNRKQRMVTKFIDSQCHSVYSEILNELYPMFRKYGVQMPILRIRDMETRWGSCLVRKGIITLNKRLLEAPRNCIEYVVMHELCHFIHPNHSKQFYGFLTMLMPDWKERKTILDKSATYWL